MGVNKAGSASARPARLLDNRNYVEIGNENNFFSLHTTLSGVLGGGREEGKKRREAWKQTFPIQPCHSPLRSVELWAEFIQLSLLFTRRATYESHFSLFVYRTRKNHADASDFRFPLAFRVCSRLLTDKLIRVCLLIYASSPSYSFTGVQVKNLPVEKLFVCSPTLLCEWKWKFFFFLSQQIFSKEKEENGKESGCSVFWDYVACRKVTGVFSWKSWFKLFDMNKMYEFYRIFNGLMYVLLFVFKISSINF